MTDRAVVSKRFVSRSLPQTDPQIVLFAVHCAESSVRYAAGVPVCAVFFGSFRKMRRNSASLWHGFRKFP